MSNNQNSSALTLKSQAKALRAYLTEEGVEITHSKALEAVSRSHGFRDWNTACKLYDPSRPLQRPRKEGFLVSILRADSTPVSTREGPPTRRVDVVVEYNHVFADDYFEGRFTDKQIESKEKEMARALAEDVAVICETQVPDDFSIDDVETTIIVNGREWKTSATHLSFAAVVRFGHARLPPNFEWMTVTYRHPDRMGAIFEPVGEPVEIGERMVFNAVFTGNA